MANSISAKSYQELVFSLQMQVKQKGQNALKALTRNLKTLFEPSHLSKEDLDQVLRASDVFVSQMDLTYLMRNFRSKSDLDDDGTMNFTQLYSILCPEPTSRRKNIIDKAWSKLDPHGNGLLPLQVLYQTYYTDNHPDVASGLRQGQDVLSRFLDAFDASEKGESGIVTKDEFIANYKLISATYPHDENAFVKMMCYVWGIREHESGVIIDTAALVTQLRDKLRLRMHGAETEEQVLIRTFKFVDLGATGYLPPDVFQQALQRLGVMASSDEIRALFDDFDRAQSGFIDYSEFIRAVVQFEEYRMKKSMTHSLFSTATKRVIT